MEQFETILSKIDGEDLISKTHDDGSSQQIQKEEYSFGDVVEPPADPALWAAQLSRNTRLNRGINTIARNTVGLGWSIVPADPDAAKTPKEKKAVEEEISRVKNFFDNLNPDRPFESLVECETIDEGATGNGYLEFTRLQDGSLHQMFHIPAITMRILKDNRGFVQCRDSRRRYFKHLGDERVMDARTGKFVSEEGTSEEGIPLEHRASEVLHFPLYSPMSEIYGIPRFVPAAAAIAGNHHAAIRNVSLLLHDAVPRMAVLVTGGTLTKESRKELQELFQEGQGPDQGGRILILQVESEGVGTDEKSNVKLELRPLTVDTTEDASFLNYRRANEEEIREVLGLSEVYFRSGKLTKASAVVAKATTDEQEFEPARLLKEHVINRRIVRGALGATKVVFRFKRPSAIDPMEQAQVDELLAGEGNVAALTPNEVRAQRGLKPFPPAEKWADLPISVALLALRGEITQGSSFASSTPKPSSRTTAPGDGDGTRDGVTLDDVGASVRRLPYLLRDGRGGEVS
jgi:capsid portal protein